MTLSQYLKSIFSTEPKPLDERIREQIEQLAANATGYANHVENKLDRRITAIEFRYRNVDANYVRVVATAMDERLAAKMAEIDLRFKTHHDLVSNLLQDIEKRCFERMDALEAELASLKRELVTTSEHLARLLARLRAVGEGN